MFLLHIHVVYHREYPRDSLKCLNNRRYRHFRGNFVHFCLTGISLLLNYLHACIDKVYHDKELLDASIWVLLAKFALINIASYFQASTEHSTVDETERGLETEDYNSWNSLHLHVYMYT